MDDRNLTKAVRAINDSGREIPAGSVCIVHAARGQEMTMGPASSATPLPEHPIVGVTPRAVEERGYALLTVYGSVRGVDTSAWPVDTELYLGDQPGTLTSAPSPDAVPICIVEAQDATDGELFVDTGRQP